ncbi:MAG TPA: 1,2-phenylacetyl-CoA epoxidase subunit PaaD [Planctomycetaceae bacterium]|jgi:ring-1,2-phenylacetyl-CoA epoxidase subunit PaaD|nr:1,2-phenylacetyl-CoA epoxidase subunit PaaD [Planctomycetaceae bacterium]
MATISETDVLSALGEIEDPEMPVISIVELGIVRDVKINGDHAEVTLAPTFSGCPALSTITESVRHKMQAIGFADVDVKLAFDPPWSTDCISETGRQKLKRMGIAPPEMHGGDVLTALELPTECPYCGSRNTTRRNSFGTTPCRAIYFCNNCVQPFERVKPL